MHLNRSDLLTLADGALEAASKAGDYALSMLGKHGETREKIAGDTGASQVVTEVDLQAQRLILEALDYLTLKYGLGILTEESVDDSSRFQSDYFWCIDPLDGTLPFTEGRSGWSVSIALVSREGIPLLGVIRDPIESEIYHAIRGEGVFRNGVIVKAVKSDSQDSLTWIMDRSMKGMVNYSELVVEMEYLASQIGAPGLNVIDHAGAALNGTWVMKRNPAVYFKFPKKSKGGGSIWDFAASACILGEYGQPPTDIFGNPLELNRSDTTFMNESGVIYASSSGLAEAVRKIYRKLSG